MDPPRSFTITWPPILQMSEKEKATIYATRAVGRSSDLLGGIISATEGRRSDDVIETYHLDSRDRMGSIEPSSESSGVQPALPPELRVVGT